MIKKVGHLFLLLLGALWYANLQIPFNIIYESFGSLLFFSIGAFFAIHKLDLVTLFARRNVGIPLLLTYLICLFITSFTRNDYCAKTLSLLSIPSAIYLTVYLYEIRLTKCNMGGASFDNGLVTATFFVFLYHYYLPTPLTYIVTNQISNFSMDASFFMRLCLSVIEKTTYLFLLYNFLKRFSPRITSLIVGGRI